MPSPRLGQIFVTALSLLLVEGGASAQQAQIPEANSEALAKAKATEAQMTDEERTALTLGWLAIPFGDIVPPEEARPGAGYVSGVPRLGVPALFETDASHGVSWVAGSRGNGATALPSGIAQGATWNPEIVEAGGAMIGSEALAKGYNVMLAGGINLMRDPRNGRTFEYVSEDPLHAAQIGAAAVRGIQSNNIIATLKHFAINPQETGRHFMNVVIDEDALRESDLLAFEMAIEQSNAGSIMCAYNRINGPLSCGSRFLLTDVLRDDWGYKGFVMSDWGAVEALDFALAGLDQQSGAALDEGLFFGEPLKEAAEQDAVYADRLGQMVRNILYAIYDHGLSADPPEIKAVDRQADEAVSLAAAQEAIVLLRNEKGVLPLSSSVGSIAVIGGYADAGTPVGGGSSRVHSDEGPSVSVPMLPGIEPYVAHFINQEYNRASPLAAIRAAAPDADITFRDGRYASEAAMAAADADVAIVFATQYMTEGYDVPDLSLPQGQDELIAAVAAANPNTIVVLETGGPVLMPWKDDVAGIVEAWYSGARGGEAISDVLFGDVNPSGHLPVTFPASVDQLPRPVLHGLDSVELSFIGAGAPGQTLDVDYNIEGSDVGYRWYARKKFEPLFPFGFGLSYTDFDLSGLEVRKQGAGIYASFVMKNTGASRGADVAQLYLVSVDGETKQRLVGFVKQELGPDEEQGFSLQIDPRLLAEWKNDNWQVLAGRYEFALGEDARNLSETMAIVLDGFSISSDGKTIVR